MNPAPNHPSGQEQLIDKPDDLLQRIVLTGYMGSGKSSIGALLAARAGWLFVDTDSALEQASGISARSLHAKLGDEEFRQYESGIFAATVANSQVIVAPGGAIVDRPENRRVLEEMKNGLIIFLDAPFDILIDRCLRQESKGHSTYRPMLQYPEQANAQYKARTHLYASIAHWTIDVSVNAPEETLEIIWSGIASRIGGTLQREPQQN
ncbi:MAG: shikimate kinase [Acidobacteriota bacterium]|nr:shikimate kinase [Acidobacteriota bacterium]